MNNNKKECFWMKLYLGLKKIPSLPSTHNSEKLKVISKPFVTKYYSFFSFRYVDEC